MNCSLKNLQIENQFNCKFAVCIYNPHRPISGNGLLRPFVITLLGIFGVHLLSSVVWSEDLCAKETFFNENALDLAQSSSACTFTVFANDSSHNLINVDLSEAIGTEEFSGSPALLSYLQDSHLFLFTVKPYQISAFHNFCQSKSKLNIKLNVDTSFNVLTENELTLLAQTFLAGYINVQIAEENDHVVNLSELITDVVVPPTSTEPVGRVIISKGSGVPVNKVDSQTAIIYTDINLVISRVNGLIHTRGQSEEIPDRFKCRH